MKGQVLLNGVTVDTNGTAVDIPTNSTVLIAVDHDAQTFGNGDVDLEISNDGGTTWFSYTRLTDIPTTPIEFRTGAGPTQIRATLTNATGAALTVIAFHGEIH